MKKRIHITSLAMRFYLQDGWNINLLKTYLKKGFDAEIPIVRKGDMGGDYLILNPNNSLDVEKLIDDGHVGELVGRDRWDELKGKTDLEVLTDRNW